jgi:hypothetical protein
MTTDGDQGARRSLAKRLFSEHSARVWTVVAGVAGLITLAATLGPGIVKT